MKTRFIFLLALFIGLGSVVFAQDANFYSKYAEKGDQEAMYNLGNCYFYGNGGVSQDYGKATYWFTKAAKKKYAPAEISLAYCYLYGAGVMKDYKEAYSLCEKAIKRNHAPAHYLMATMYKEGYYVTPNVSMYWHYLNSAARLGDGSALADLGYYYLYGFESNNIQANYEKAVQCLQAASDLGNAQAKRLMGVCYQYGAGVQEDIAKSVAFYKEAADLGDGPSQCTVAEAYLKGKGLEKDYNAAIRYVNAAVEKEIPMAYKLTGDIYYYGLGVEENDELAAQWYQSAVDNEVVSAYSQLASLYMRGHGVQENSYKAYQLYQKGAELENVDCYVGLAVCLENGMGVNQDIKSAVKYYKLAAEADNSYSLHRLYVTYREGADGIAKNEDEAIGYLRQSADLGYVNAIYSLGYEYMVGEALHQDNEKALEYMTKAADEGYVFASAVLGVFYYTGEYDIVSKDYNMAFKHLYAAVQDTSDLNEGLLLDVYKYIGACYRFGRGTEVNQSLASYYTEKAAQLGDSDSVNAVKMLRK